MQDSVRSRRRVQLHSHAQPGVRAGARQGQARHRHLPTGGRQQARAGTTAWHGCPACPACTHLPCHLSIDHLLVGGAASMCRPGLRPLSPDANRLSPAGPVADGVLDSARVLRAFAGADVHPESAVPGERLPLEQRLGWARMAAMARCQWPWLLAEHRAAGCVSCDSM